MVDLSFACIDVSSDPYAAGPTLVFRLRVSESTGERIHALGLRVQMRIEPQKRRYTPAESAKLNDLFGDPTRYADTLKPVQFAMASIMVPSFTGDIEVDLHVPCTYDMEVASTGYFHALEEGSIPLLMLFSGTAIAKGTTGFSVSQVPWNLEATYLLPVSEWRAMMERFFPSGSWVRLGRETLAALGAFKNTRALATWEQAVDALLAEASRPTELLP
ncbi:DUF6084 family protein [Sporichthya sp.]|uniref:DUF6084 family protein n=1 Tax=Sporichthya sp. TaxID=65475 RepID=UPI001807BB9B|nr:DUF6084 family protein [Sporichthya sp.]MBA3743719.1 hypothetical protein [Sporichthya sp.]